MKRKLISIIIVGIILISIMSIATEISKAEEEYKYQWSSIENDNETLYYEIIPKNESDEWSLDLTYYEENRTVSIDISNINNLTLYFNEFDFDITSSDSILEKWNMVVIFRLTSDVETVGYEFHDIGRFDTLEMDGETFYDYEYEGMVDGTLFIELEHSTVEFRLNYENWFDSFVYWIIAVMWALMTLDVLVLGLKSACNDLEEGL